PFHRLAPGEAEFRNDRPPACRAPARCRMRRTIVARRAGNRDQYGWDGYSCVLHGGCIDFVVLGMRADEFDVNRLEVIREGHDQTIVVAFDVEYDAVFSDENGGGITVFDVLWRGPARRFRFIVPSL